MSDDPSGQISHAAKSYGIALSEDALEEHAAGFNSMLEGYEALEAIDPVDDPATDVSEADDEFNALRHTFSLPIDAKHETLAGLEIGIKENIAVAGIPLTCGSAALSYTPETHATVVRRLAEAGGDVRATTNMDEFAYFTTGETCAHGPTDNPAVRGHVPGGSSSGSGAAVAAGLLDAALGSDTGGSVRIPASYCSVVGLKPTHSLVSRFGFVDLAPSLDHVGVLAESVDVTGRVFETIAGPDYRDPSTRGMPNPGDVGVPADVDGLHVGVVAEGMNDASDAVEKRIDTTIETLADAGVEAGRVSLPTFGAVTPALLATVGLEFAHLIADNGQVYGTGTGYSEELRAAIDGLTADELGDNVTGQLLTHGGLLADSGERYYIGAQRVREQFIGEVEEVFAEYDALALPTTPTTAPTFGSVTDDESFLRTVSHTAPFNATGHPALSVPCGDVDGHPVGLQIVTTRHDEATALGLGAVVEGA